NVVSYWHAGDKRFRAPLHRVLGELRRSKAGFYISAITIQELGQWAIVGSALPALQQFLTAARLHVLPFDRECARRTSRAHVAAGAARGGSRRPPPRPRRSPWRAWRRRAGPGCRRRRTRAGSTGTAGRRSASPMRRAAPSAR